MEPKESKTSKHFTYSLIKSVFRIGSGVSLIFGKMWCAGILLIIAEIFGVIEEI